MGNENDEIRILIMEKGLIYLQKEFWTSFERDRNRPDRIVTFGKMYDVLTKSNILTNIPERDWETNPLLYYLCQDSSDSNGPKIKQTKLGEIEESLYGSKSIRNVTTVFLLDKSTMMCDGYSRRMGILCLNADMIYKKEKYLNIIPIPHHKNDEESEPFSTCKEFFIAPCNSVIIIDPYILLDEKKYSVIEIIDNNVVPLLDSILPDSIDIEGGFHISIFSQPLNSKIGIEEIFTHIKDEIMRIRPKLTVNISIFHIKTPGNGKGVFHNRYVLTNTLFIKCGYGFAVYEKKGEQFLCTKEDTINVFYPTLLGNRVEYVQWINNCKKESPIKEGPIEGLNNRLLGNPVETKAIDLN